MLSSICKTIDRLTIRAAAASLQADARDCNAAEASALVADDAYLDFAVETPGDFREGARGNFSFTSPLASPWPENNVVHGKLFRVGHDWTSKPAVILLHGWNGERGYYWQFPYLAWRLNRLGLNAAMIELPYHAQRKPSARDAVRNFISRDLLRMVEAARQAVADTRALAAWLCERGSPAVGVWGISLGAWLGGLAACYEPRLKFAVLLSPVVRMDQAVLELEFCAPIRDSLAGVEVSLDRFNLASHKPLLAPEDILIVESIHDLFAPAETIEHLWEVWGRTQIKRVPHGHITVLASLPVMEHVTRWIAAKTQQLALTPAS